MTGSGLIVVVQVVLRPYITVCSCVFFWSMHSITKTANVESHVYPGDQNVEAFGGQPHDGAVTETNGYLLIWLTYSSVNRLTNKWPVNVISNEVSIYLLQLFLKDLKTNDSWCWFKKLTALNASSISSQLLQMNAHPSSQSEPRIQCSCGLRME